jgi:peptidoglycan lytic transglycosylase
MTRGAGTLLGGMAALTVLACGCSHIPRPGSLVDSYEFGGASFYGREFEGRRTASGERYDGEALTAAHRTLPFGTRVRIVNLANDRAVEVVINDRGPHRKGRIVDLSHRAAELIGLLRVGVGRVRLEVIASPAADRL